MSRPNDVRIKGCEAAIPVWVYLEDLEKYCDELESQICDTCASSFLYEENKRLKKYIDELEKANYEYMQSQHALFMELQKYRKALDKACVCLSSADKIFESVDIFYQAKTKEEWEEWCMKDEPD